jgi:hypothetical protein
MQKLLPKESSNLSHKNFRSAPVSPRKLFTEQNSVIFFPSRDMPARDSFQRSFARAQRANTLFTLRNNYVKEIVYAKKRLPSGFVRKDF